MDTNEIPTTEQIIKMDLKTTTRNKLNIKERKLMLARRKKKTASEILDSLKVFLLRPLPRVFLLKMSCVAVGTQRGDDDMALLLDCDVLQREYEENSDVSDFSTYEGGGGHTPKVTKVVKVSREGIWKHVLEYFCPSYALARDIENYIPDCIAFADDNLANDIFRESSKTEDELTEIAGPSHFSDFEIIENAHSAETMCATPSSIESTAGPSKRKEFTGRTPNRVYLTRELSEEAECSPLVEFEITENVKCESEEGCNRKSSKAKPLVSRKTSWDVIDIERPEDNSSHGSYVEVNKYLKAGGEGQERRGVSKPKGKGKQSYKHFDSNGVS